VNVLIVFIPRIEMSSFDIKLYNINHNTNQQYQYYLISLLISIDVLLSRVVVFSSISAVGNTSKTIDSKAGDSLMQPLSEQTQSEKSNIILVAATTPNSLSLSNFKTATKYEFVKKWGSNGTGEGQFPVPYSVDVDSKGDVWVADRGNPRIQKFDKDGNFLFKLGSVGSKEDQFNNPKQVAVDINIKYLYVADSKNNRIQKFDTKHIATEKM
jgi:DNA-binding beta-propeller fold protein YncE